MTETISQAQQANAPASSNNIPANGDMNARQDAASMMMSMSHLMDAAAAHAHQQQTNLPASASGRLPAEQPVMDGAQIHSHHNHTSRGPHKKRSASNADLDEDLSNARSGAAQTNGMVNEGGVLRLPVTSTSEAVTASASIASGTSTSNSSTSNVPLSEEEKKAERRAANRRSAFQSRQRRKILIEDLQRTVAALSKDNSDIRKSNDEIRSQLEAALLENRQLRQITSSLSAQAHVQQAQAAAQQAQHQHQQQTAPVGQQQQSGSSPTVSAQQAPPPVPSVSLQQTQVPSTAPSPFATQSLSSPTAALSNFLANFSSQAAGAASTTEQQHHIFNAKIALMAAQSRVSELEHHQAAQAQAAANAAVAQQQQHHAQLQAQAQAAASAALGLAHVQTSAPGTNALADAQHLARLQELLTRGISNASAATAPVSTAVPAVASTNAGAQVNSTGISAAGVDLSHLRSLLEAQQQQHRGIGAVKAPGAIPPAPESPSRNPTQEQKVASNADGVTRRDSASGETSEASGNVEIISKVTAAPQASSTVTPAISTVSSNSTVRPATIHSAANQDAPGIQLLIESLRAGHSGGNGNASAPPLDEAVRNYIKQQQMAQQQAQQTNNAACAIKTESN